MAKVNATAPKKTETTKSKVRYAVEATNDYDFSGVYETIQEAFNAEIEGNGSSGDKYIYKIELIGKVKQELKIEPIN